jgi:hypothetical protein
MPLTARPNLGELAERVRAALVSDVLPALGPDADIARNQLGSVLSLLSWLSAHWDNQAQLLTEEIEGLERLLLQSEVALREAGLGAEAESIRDVLARRETRVVMTALIRRSDELQEGLLEVARLVLGEEAPASLHELREPVILELNALVRRRVA